MKAGEYVRLVPIRFDVHEHPSGAGDLKVMACERCQKDVAVADTATFLEALQAISEHLALEHVADEDSGEFAVAIRIDIDVLGQGWG